MSCVFFRGRVFSIKVLLSNLNFMMNITPKPHIGVLTKPGLNELNGLSVSAVLVGNSPRSSSVRVTCKLEDAKSDPLGSKQLLFESVDGFKESYAIVSRLRRASGSPERTRKALAMRTRWK